jgi:hypothetical protein
MCLEYDIKDPVRTVSVTLSMLQRSPTSSYLLQFCHNVAGLGLEHWVVGRRPYQAMGLAYNGVAFGVTSLVGGIVMRLIYPLGVWLKNRGSPVSVDSICGCHFSPWRHRCGKTHSSLLVRLFSAACMVAFDGVASEVRW